MLNDLLKQKVYKIFQIFDANNNGVIEAVDMDIINKKFREAYKLEWAEDSDKKFKAVFSQFWRRMVLLHDENNDSIISLEEFYKAYESHLSSQTNYDEMIRPFLDNIFPLVDTDKDGFLDLKEFTKFFCIFHNDEALANEFFTKIDVNKNQKLSSLEVYAFLHNFHFGE